MTSTKTFWSEVKWRDPRLPARFWDKVHVAGCGCWIWNGYVSETGYGMFSGQKVHRIIAALIFGSHAIEGYEVLHDCPGGDNKRCLRPDHLFIGTASENARDAVLKGQRPRTRGPASKLDGRDHEILAAIQSKPFYQAASELGISDTQLRRWCVGFCQRVTLTPAQPGGEP